MKKKTDLNKLNKWINKEETDMNKELFKKKFLLLSTICIIKKSKQNK